MSTHKSSQKVTTSVRFPGLRSLLLAGCVLGSALLTGCAPTMGGPQQQGPGVDDEDAITYTLKAPTFTTLAPTAVAVGDEVTVLGKDFIDPKHGELQLYMMGTFTDESGHDTRINGITVPLTYDGAGKAHFEFGPTVMFAPKGNELGTFKGNFQVVNKLVSKAMNAEPGDYEPSEAASLRMEAKPSLLIDEMRAVDPNVACERITTATTTDANLAIGVHAIGMADATDSQPITYTYSFTSPGLIASYVEDKAYDAWPYTDSGSGTPPKETESGSFSFSFRVTDGTAALVDPLNKEMVVSVNPPVTVSQTAVNQTEVKLARLASGKYDQPGHTNFTLVITAEHANGQTISRTIVFPVWNQIELPKFNGVSELKEIYQAEITDVGCVSGGNRPLNYQYSEGSSESKSRTINMSWNTNYSKSLGVQSGVNFGFGLPVVGGVGVNLGANEQLTWSQTFGIDNSWTVSTETHKNGSYTVDLIPTQFAVSYKQPTRYERKIDVIYHNACGMSGPIGQAILTDWKWNFSVNSGPSCQPPPPSTLPPPQTF